MEANDSLVIQEKTSDGYELSKMNAMQHGVLTKQAILEWENLNDYEQLKKSFFVEYAPTTATEIHLVEELINIVWRKKRIQRAENVELQKRISGILFPDFSWNAASISKIITLEKDDQLREMNTNDIFSLSESALQNAIDMYQKIIKKVESVRILRNQRIVDKKPLTYTEFLEKLDQSIQEDWATWIGQKKDGKTYQAIESSLHEWLVDYIEYLKKKIIEFEFKHQHFDQLKTAYIGLGLVSFLENTSLMRYEVHLDRKFERILAMLLKIQEMRRSQIVDTIPILNKV